MRSYSLLSIIAAGLLAALAVWLNTSCGHPRRADEPDAAAPHAAVRLTRQDVHGRLSGHQLFNPDAARFTLQHNQQRFLVQTSLDIALQQHLQAEMDRKNARLIAIVLIKPDTGRVIALTGYNKADPQCNPCLQSGHPAASIFKIITAAAAVETCGFDAETRLAYNGRKYTLYKSQLKKTRNRYTRHVNLKESFAQSINPVFGKIGVHCLQQNPLQEYAVRFGFNQPLDFELPLAPSTIRVTREPYQWAEIASGFNRTTRISPLHGALIAATVANDGRQPSPSVVERIFDTDGHSVYARREQAPRAVIAPSTAAVMRNLMRATIQSGTCRKIFRHYRRDPILKHLDLGGKTGSIGTNEPDVRYDWFVGFASDEKGRSISAAAMVVHEKYIGTRAGAYARMAFKAYFERRAGEKTAPI